MHVKRLAIAVGLAGTLAMVTYTAHASPLSAQDFVTKASSAGEFEIESSKIALNKAQDGHVSAFANNMVTDHTNIGRSLREVLQSSDSKAQATDKLDEKQEKLLGELQAASGKEFDSRYIAIQTDAHKDAVRLFNNYSKYGKDRALKNFATDTLPMLKDHLKAVEQLDSVTGSR